MTPKHTKALPEKLEIIRETYKNPAEGMFLTLALKINEIIDFLTPTTEGEEVNYVDSRTDVERERDNKIETTTTFGSSEQKEADWVEEFDELWFPLSGDTTKLDLSRTKGGEQVKSFISNYLYFCPDNFYF